MTKLNYEKLNRQKSAEKEETVYVKTGSFRSVLTPYDLQVIARSKPKAVKQTIGNELNAHKSKRKQKNKAQVKKFRKRLANKRRPKKEAKAVFEG